DTLSVKLSALYQDLKGYTSPFADPTLGDLRQSTIPGTGALRMQTQAYSLTLSDKIGNVELTSVSGYNLDRTPEFYQDISLQLGSLSQAFFNTGGTTQTIDNRTRTFSQELRALVPLGKVDWLVGLFYDDQHSDVANNWYVVVPTTGEILGNLLIGTWSSTY